MSFKNLALASLFGATTLVSPAGYCLQWPEWLGPELQTFSANFDQYEFDQKTGKMDGPTKGSVSLERPGLASIRFGEKTLSIRGDQIQANECGKCTTVKIVAEKIFNSSLREFIASGVNAKELMASSAYRYADAESDAFQFSLQPAGIANATMTLWRHGNKPVAIEIDTGDGKKTILQLYQVRRNGSLVEAGNLNQ